MKVFSTFLFILISLVSLAQKTVTFDTANNLLIFTDAVSGQTVIKTYPVAQCFYSYEASLNRISLYFNAPNRETIYSGSFSSITVSGKTSTADKLVELNARINSGPPTGGGSGGGGTSTVISDYVLTTVAGHNGQTTGSYTIPATATYWNVCNVGNANATITDGTTSEVMTLTPGLCLGDEIKFRGDNKQALKVSPITINATGTTVSYRWK